MAGVVSALAVLAVVAFLLDFLAAALWVVAFLAGLAVESVLSAAGAGVDAGAVAGAVVVEVPVCAKAETAKSEATRAAMSLFI